MDVWVQNQIDSEFVTKELPDSMQRLNDLGGPAKHEPDSYGMTPPLAFKEVDAIYCEFLGIGQPGILPALARIGPNVATAIRDRS